MIKFVNNVKIPERAGPYKFPVLAKSRGSNSYVLFVSQGTCLVLQSNCWRAGELLSDSSINHAHQWEIIQEDVLVEITVSSKE